MYTIQSIFFKIHSFLYYIFDKMSLRVKPEYDFVDDDIENVVLNQQIER